jgi:hypothetical protein
MLRSRVWMTGLSWSMVSIGLLALLISSALLVGSDSVSTGVLDQLHAAAKGACTGVVACPGACVPPGACQPNVGGACVPGVAGTVGCALTFSTIGSCTGILGTCTITTPCGADVNPSCPAFVNGMCPPGVCTRAAVGTAGC